MRINLKINRNIRLGFFYSFLTILIFLLIFKFGVSAAVRISEFLQRSDSETPFNLTDTIVPSPQLFPLPEATNSAILSISGFSSPNQKVEVYINEKKSKVLDIDSEGKFAGEISLSLGINRVWALTINNENITSPPSQTLTVFYANSPPLLDILEPAPESVIKKKKEAIIKGKVEKTSKVTINGHFVVVNQDGFFNYPVTLREGENKFTIVCTDPAQNQTQKELKVYFQP